MVVMAVGVVEVVVVVVVTMLVMVVVVVVVVVAAAMLVVSMTMVMMAMVTSGDCGGAFGDGVGDIALRYTQGANFVYAGAQSPWSPTKRGGIKAGNNRRSDTGTAVAAHKKNKTQKNTKKNMRTHASDFAGRKKITNSSKYERKYAVCPDKRRREKERRQTSTGKW